MALLLGYFGLGIVVGGLVGKRFADELGAGVLGGIFLGPVLGPLVHVLSTIKRPPPPPGFEPRGWR